MPEETEDVEPTIEPLVETQAVHIEPRAMPSQETTDALVMAQYDETTKAGFPTAKMLGVMSQFAAHCVKTQQMPKTIDTAEKAILVFQAGRELGIPPMKALYSFYFVNNKLTLYGPTVVERIRGWAKIEYGTCNDIEATVTITRKDDGTSLSATVTMEDLKKRGLTGGKDTFTKHPKTMLLYKAVGEIVRHIVPEAVGACAIEGDWGNDAASEMSAPTYRSQPSPAIDLDAERLKISSCKSIEELQMVWANLKPAAKQALTDTRDEMKAILETEAKEDIT